MKKYVHSQEDAAIVSAEFTPMAGGNMAYLTLRKGVPSEGVRRMLAENQQDVIAETKQGERTVLVTRGPRSQEQLLNALEKGGEPLKVHEDKKGTEPWVVRSLLGFGGQSLQLISAFMRPPRGGVRGWANVDKPQFLFAATNLTANGINLVYKGNDLPDPSRTMHVKQMINDTLVRELKPGEKTLDVRDDRMVLRDPDYHSRRALTGFHGFMQKHSVSVGELGLRYVGAFGMAYPLDKIGQNGKLLNPHPASLRHFTGMASMAGKTIALTAKVPDPYNPAAQTWFGKIRENISFKLGGWIETAAFSALAYDAFFNTGDVAANKILEAGGKETMANAVRSRGIQSATGVKRDWLGGLGASMFVAGYIVRHFAKYGSRHVNMQEIYAHAGDTLAKLPPDKVPQALADISGQLAEHFKDDKRVSYASIYSHLAGDLCRYHQVEAKRADVPEVVVEETPEEQLARPAVHVQAGSAVHTPPAPVTEKSLASV